MIDLYGMSSPNVFKVSIMLEETSLPWRFHHVNIFKGEQFTPDFLAIGPNNKVPVIVDQDGPGGAAFPVFESGAILIYLAEKTGLLLSADARRRSVELQWLMMQMGSVGPMIGQLNHFLRYRPAGHEYPVDRYTSEMRRIMTVLETRLAASRHLGGDELSIADIAVFPWVRVLINYVPPFQGKEPAVAFTDYPSIQRWFSAILARPAVARGIEALETTARPKDLSEYQAASPDDIDRLLGRGKFSRA